MSTPINIPLNLAPTVLLENYGPKRSFSYVAAGTSPGASHIKIWGSADGVNFPPVTATPLVDLGGESKQPTTIEDLSLRYRAQVVSGTGLVCTVDVQLDCCENGGAFLQTTTIADRPAGGPIGPATTTVDEFEAFLVDQTTAGQTLTLPAPTNTDATRRAYVENVGSVSFNLYGQSLQPGAWLELLWNGSTWTPSVGNSDGTSSSLGAAGGANSMTILAGSGDMLLFADNGGKIQAFTDSDSIQLDTSAGGNIEIGATLGTAKTITIGNLVGATHVAVEAGTVGFTVQTAAGGPIAMATGTTGTVTIDSGTTGAINIGTGPNAKSVTIGSITGAASLALRAGSGGLSIINNGLTWLWPTADGAAGTKLTTNGAGVLSFT